MTNDDQYDTRAQCVLSTQDLNKDLSFFYELGFRLEQIFPADDPAVAIISGHGMYIRLDKTSEAAPGTLHLLTDNPALQGNILTAPNGTVVEVHPRSYQLNNPPTRHKFEVRQLKDNDSWIIGRAGMLYRDLIPDRLGGSIIASHISIPEGGPVPDMVHYHTIGFQLIFCYKGWVRLVYEDQGPPFTLGAGDCVTQPPEIRHRVLESSDQLEVIEIGIPAEHMTTIDHEMELPNDTYNPEREFQGQRFCHHISADAQWAPWKMAGLEYRDTGVNEATKGLASVVVVRPVGGGEAPVALMHNADILFRFVLQGELELQVAGKSPVRLQPRDAFVIPLGMRYQLQDCTEDLEILEVALPGNYQLSLAE